MDNMEHGNRIFKIKETVVKSCGECKKEFKNPSLNYYVQDNNKICCPKCAEKYTNKELRAFVDMDDISKVNIIKDF